MLACAASGAVPAPAAANVSMTVTAGDVSVTLAADKGTVDRAADLLRDARGLTVQIARAGVVVRSAAALAPCRYFCGVPGVVGARVVDLDGDGEREVLVDRSDGFNVCCTQETALLARDPSSGDYSELDVRFGSAYRVLDGALVRGDDVRFYTRYEPRVIGVYLPVRLWQVRQGRPRDVTRAHPDRVRRDLKGLDRAVAAHARGANTDLKRRLLRATLPAWAADNELLGRHATVTHRLRGLVAAERIDASFQRSLRRLLVRLGYRRWA